MTDTAFTATEIATLRALVVGREPPDLHERLVTVADQVASGEVLADADRRLLTRLRHDYGRELAELTDPE
jgi:multidrug efflux pump subunit AcrA (membrane-fusion protein)